MQNRITPQNGTINIVALFTARERYIVLYDDEHVVEAKRTLGRWASNPDLSFSWCNASDLCAKVGQMGRERQKETKIRKAR